MEIVQKSFFHGCVHFAHGFMHLKYNDAHISRMKDFHMISITKIMGWEVCDVNATKNQPNLTHLTKIQPSLT